MTIELYSDIRILLDIEMAGRSFHYSDRDGPAHKTTTSTEGRVVVEADVIQYRGLITNDVQIKEAIGIGKDTSPSVSNVGITVFNEDNLHRLDTNAALESADATLTLVRGDMYDEVIGTMVGKIDSVDYDFSTLSFQIRSEEITLSKKIPEHLLQDDTFQTQLVLFDPVLDITAPLDFRMQIAMNTDAFTDVIVKKVYHPMLDGHDNDYWVGARVDVVNGDGSFGDPESDSFSIGEFATVTKSQDDWVQFNTSIDRYFLYTFANSEMRDDNPDGKARGSLICLAPGSLSDGDNFTLDDGTGNRLSYYYDVSGSYTPPAGGVEINIVGAGDAGDVAALTNTAINGSTINITSNNQAGSAVVDLLNDYAGTHGNQPILESLAAGTLSPVGMSGSPYVNYETRDCINNTMVNTAKLSEPTVTNGDFTFGSVGWLLGTGWTVSAGKAHKASGTVTDLRQDLDGKIVANTIYVCKVTAYDLAGSEGVLVSFSGGTTTAAPYLIETNDEHEFEIDSGDHQYLTFTPKNSTDAFSLDFISLRTRDGVTMMITRRGVPENADSVGRPFPIVYGQIEKMWSVWSTSTKSTRQNSVSAGNDMYVIAGHKIYDQNPTEVRVYFGLDENAQGINVKPGILDFVPNPMPRSVSEIDRWHENGYDLRSGDPEKDVSPLHKLVEIATNDGKVVTAIKLRGDEYTGWYTNNVGGSLSDGRMPGINEQPQFPIRYGLGNSKLYVSFRGMPDTTGEITGVIGGLIEHPIDIIKHLLLNYTNINNDISKLDEQSFLDAKGRLPNWKFAVAITDVADGVEIWSRLCEQCKASWNWSNGQFQIQVTDLQNTTPTVFLTQQKHFAGNQKWSRPKIADVFNDFTFKYKYNAITQEYDGVIRRSKANDQRCRDSYAQYGVVRSFGEIEFPDIQDPYTANAMADHYVDLYAVTRKTLRTELLIESETASLEPGTVCSVTYDDPNGTEVTETYLLLSTSVKRYRMQAEFLELV